MVKAILEGRKTQTRRIFKDHPRLASDIDKIDLKQWLIKYPDLILGYSPFGKPGDLLWVRETHFLVDEIGEYVYKVDYSAEDLQNIKAHGDKWKPSIHMPKAAARIWLKVTNVRVERLQDISEADAIAEGLIHSELFNEWGGVEPHPEVKGHYRWYQNPIDAFKNLWESINGDGSWKENPWVWVIEFERSEQTCKVCGCTQFNACVGGCFWVEPGLCSKCKIESYVDRINKYSPGLNLSINDLIK